MVSPCHCTGCSHVESLHLHLGRFPGHRYPDTRVVHALRMRTGVYLEKEVESFQGALYHVTVWTVYRHADHDRL